MNPRLATSLKLFSQAASVLAALVGCLVLVGWAFDLAVLRSVSPGFVAMSPVTALTFMLAGVSLWMLRKEGTDSQLRRLGQACALVVASVGMLKLIGYLTGWDVGIDQVLFREKLGADQGFGLVRIAPNTALNFLLLGLALVLLDVKARQGTWPAQPLALTATVISLMSLLGYAYGAPYFYTVTSYIPMALNTTLAFLVLSVGILCARSDRGLMGIVTSESPGGILIRRMLLAAVAILPVLGWLRLVGQHEGLFNTEFGIALLVLTSITVVTLLGWFTAVSLDRADAARTRAEEERNRFFSLSRDMLCTAGFNGYFKELNPAWEETLGYTKAELLARPYIEFIHPDDRAATLAQAEKVSGGNAILAFENRYRCKDGSYRWFLWSATPVFEERLIYATARDVTDRKQAEEEIKKSNEQLEASNKELEAFSYSVSHDLRAPLRHIDGFSDLLQKQAASLLDEKGHRYLKNISESAKQMGVLIDDLLAFSRVGRAELRMTTVDLNPIVKGVLSDMTHDIQGRHIAWEIGTLPVVYGDSAMLRQVLANLIGNAVKYTHRCEKAHIEIGCNTGDPKETIVFVRDNGVGFDMQYAHKLFNVFQRLHSSSEFEGTGIGLANVHRIIQRHGGRTWAEGESDKGATFYFTLPERKDIT